MDSSYFKAIRKIDITPPTKSMHDVISKYKSNGQNSSITNVLLSDTYARRVWRDTAAVEPEEAEEVKRRLQSIGMFYGTMDVVQQTLTGRSGYACVGIRTESIVKMSMLTEHHAFWEFFKYTFGNAGSTTPLHLLGAALNDIDDFYKNLPWLCTLAHPEYAIPNSMWELNNESEQDGTTNISDIKAKIKSDIKQMSPVRNFKILSMEEEDLKEISFEDEGYTAKCITTMEEYSNYLINHIVPKSGTSNIRSPWSGNAPPQNSVYIILYEKDNELKLICHLSLYYERCGWYKIENNKEIQSDMRRIGGRIGGHRRTRKLAETFLDD